MVSTVEKVITKICTTPELREKFMCKKNINEMYLYCRSITGGYTKAEFDEFINKMYKYACKNMGREE